MSLSHEHVGSKIPATINTFMLTRAELLIHLCYEIPCSWHFQCPLPTSPCQHSLWTTPSGNTARAPQSQSSSLDWLNPFTWFYRGDGERNNEEMKGSGGSSVINVQSQRKILRRRLGLVNIVRSYWFTYIIISESS